MVKKCSICGGTHPKKECAENENTSNKSVSVTGLSCPIMEDCEFVSWLTGDKNILTAALNEIYNIRGEDKEIARIVNEALEAGQAR